MKRLSLKRAKKIKKKILPKIKSKPKPIRIKKEKRQKEVKLRKNFLATLIITIFLWLSLAFIIYFVDPFSFAVIPTFLTLVFFAILFTFSILFANSRRGLLTASGLTIFLILRYFGVGNILNLLLLTAFVITIELYLSH
ncbi:hypothetical protein A2Z22_02560 [Candidatus Woesebacteria bacterium RBG_16_34_12]|uniref:Uncharacterized protein n=1 Tax=Candidatus Woesebacteria bacterium RBG_16_34_12 TaxID=1802480 RepID=A0A1F7XA55_9BACT|nr:MAG: hypothetical protein A2Z22_02560 [Candidatus Woesebacteria bacterium RBG_16_34_12]